MRIGIISTVGDYSWAGSEEMWKLFATEALRRGHSVAAMLQTPIAQSDELAEFRALGGVVFAYNPLNRYTSRTVSRGLYSRFRRLKRWNPDIVCTSGPSSHSVSRPGSLQVFKSTHRSLGCSSYKATRSGISPAKPNARRCERFIARRGESSASRVTMRSYCRDN